MRILRRTGLDAAAVRLRVVCFAHAGAGAAMFRTWPDALPAGIELVCPSLPGRDVRAAEQPLADMPSLVARVAADVSPLLDMPYCLFGHSLGAFVAFELAHELAHWDARQPVHLFVAAQRSPRLPHPQAPIYALPDAEFLAGVQRRHEALPAALLADPEMKRYLTRLLRADFILVEAYRSVRRDCISCPITAFGGREDTAVPAALLPGWAEETSGACETVLLPGGHFFLRTHPDAFFSTFSECLERAISESGH